MKAVIQRVSKAEVKAEGITVGRINCGFLVLLGVCKEDTIEDVNYLVNKIVNLRLFSDENDKFNFSLKDIKGELLVVSQFTLFADCKKGRRPSFEDAAKPDTALQLYNKFIDECMKHGLKVETGRFQAMMDVELCNKGPVTVILDSKI